MCRAELVPEFCIDTICFVFDRLLIHTKKLAYMVLFGFRLFSMWSISTCYLIMQFGCFVVLRFYFWMLGILASMQWLEEVNVKFVFNLLTVLFYLHAWLHFACLLKLI